MLLLVDLRQGQNAGPAIIRQLTDQWPHIRVMALSPTRSDEERQTAKTGDSPYPATLTPREREVLHCLAMGYDNREIAEQLTIAIRTVNRHLENIRRKLRCTRRSELIRFARNIGAR
jgi:DNA-binding NarL/FixJ family response regulator